MTQRLMTSGVNPMTGPFKADDGSAAAPSVTFAGAPTTGLFNTDTGIGVAVGGVKTGDLRFQLPIGLGPVPWSGTFVPAGWVACFGQTLLRATYPDLWVFAQAEIANTNPFFNNGDGTTTFGVPDMRGRVVACADNIGGVAAGRLPGFTIWVAGGAASKTLIRSDLPNVAPTFTGASSTLSITSTVTGGTVGGRSSGLSDGSNRGTPITADAIVVTSTGTVIPLGTIQDINGGVTQTAFSLVQPTVAFNQIIFAGA